MKKYKTLSRISFVLAVILLGVTVFYFFNPEKTVTHPGDGNITGLEVKLNFNSAIIAGVLDILLWISFVYFLRKSKKT